MIAENHNRLAKPYINMKNLEKNINRYQIKHERNNSYVGQNREKIIDLNRRKQSYRIWRLQAGPTFSLGFSPIISYCKAEPL